MKSSTYNDMAFSLEQAAERWNILCQRADGKSAYVATGVFVGVPENEVEASPWHWSRPPSRSASRSSARM